jgi:hypothetical protein
VLFTLDKSVETGTPSTPRAHSATRAALSLETLVPELTGQQHQRLTIAGVKRGREGFHDMPLGIIVHHSWVFDEQRKCIVDLFRELRHR